jgi:hypothetical protein
VFDDNDYSILDRLALGQGEKPFQVDDGENLTAKIHDAQDVLRHTGDPGDPWCRKKLNEILRSESIRLVPEAQSEVLEMDRFGLRGEPLLPGPANLFENPFPCSGGIRRHERDSPR